MLDNDESTKCWFNKAQEVGTEIVFIFTEPVNKDSQQWINIIVANKKDENNTVYKDVVKAYETEATKKTIAKAYPDKSTIPAWGLKLK